MAGNVGGKMNLPTKEKGFYYVQLFNRWFRPLWRGDGTTAARCGKKGFGY